MWRPESRTARGGSMRGGGFPLLWRVFVVAAGFVAAVTFSMSFTPSAQALPSFARQTGQPCGTCHTDFPALTPYGRRFKLLGYTTGGGQFRTTPFPVFPNASDSQSQNDKMSGYLKALESGSDYKDYVPPISMMAVVGFTHTEAPQVPAPAPFASNDNTIVSPVSGFWGGAITDHIGA